MDNSANQRFNDLTFPDKKLNYHNLKEIFSVATPLCLTGKDHIIKLANDSFCSLFRIGQNELLGKKCHDLYHNSMCQDSSRCPLKDGLKDQACRKYEIDKEFDDGTKIHCIVMAHPYTDLNNEVIGIISSFTDITKYKNVVSQLEQVNRDLIKNAQMMKILKNDKFAMDRELRNTQRQLIYSEKLASIGYLAAGVAHEINNPIGYISTNLSVLKKYINDVCELFSSWEVLKSAVSQGDMDKIKRMIHQISQQEEKANHILSNMVHLLEESIQGVEKIKKIVLDLKTFARHEKDTMSLINLNEVLEGILNVVWNEIKYKAQLIKKYGQISSIECNPQKLGQVFINILINASQSIEDKGEIVITTYEKDKYIHTKISDTGKGIPKSEINRIFDPFYTTKKTGEGTGLGLSLSYEIIKKYGGDISVESTLNQGTTFLISLPKKQS